jgi:hypothetical protein
MSHDEAVDFLSFINETLTATIVITAISMLLYNLVRNIRDRVTRASAAVLSCVTAVYTVESITGLDPTSSALEPWYRLQWIGIAFMPAAMFHLADALLSTTGRTSRGRRRLVVRLLYIFSTCLTLIAAFSNLLIKEIATTPVAYMKPGPLFPLYTAYFVVACVVSMWLVWRARERCLTTSTRRRMTLLLIVFLTPAIGTFPYTPLFEGFGNGASLPLLPLTVTFVAANLFVVGMLIFMAYPLSFFGTNKPDRIIKTELLQFLLRGPFTAAVLLAALASVPRLSRPLGLKSEDFVLIAAIAVVLGMQWSITLVMPFLENLLIFNRDQQEARQLRRISERMLTRADTVQLLEAVLAAACDQLRVPTAFIAALQGDKAYLEQVVGYLPKDHVDELNGLGHTITDSLTQYGDMYIWKSFWLLPVREEDLPEAPLVGLMGIWAREIPPQLGDEETDILHILCHRAAKVLVDRQLQTQAFASFNEFALDMEDMRQLESISRFGYIQQEPLEDSDAFVDQVWGALRDFWGGPRLAESQLMQLEVVQREQAKQGGNPARALQAVLTQAIESLKPHGERGKTTDWILYNILEMRFLQGKKVRDVTQQLFMSEPDFYRKQRIAIEEVARYISEMERTQRSEQEAPSNFLTK